MRKGRGDAHSQEHDHRRSTYHGSGKCVLHPGLSTAMVRQEAGVLRNSCAWCMLCTCGCVEEWGQGCRERLCGLASLQTRQPLSEKSNRRSVSTLIKWVRPPVDMVVIIRAGPRHSSAAPQGAAAAVHQQPPSTGQGANTTVPASTMCVYHCNQMPQNAGAPAFKAAGWQVSASVALCMCACGLPSDTPTTPKGAATALCRHSSEIQTARRHVCHHKTPTQHTHAQQPMTTATSLKVRSTHSSG